MAINNNIYKDNENKLKDRIEKVNLSLLVLVSVKDFNLIKQFYTKDNITDIEIAFSKKLLEFKKNNKLFRETYILGEGIFALICDLRLFTTLKKELLGFFDEFVDNINESYLLIKNSKYDLNIDLSYAIGKYKLYDDAKQGLIEVRKRQKNVYFANDSSYISKNVSSINNSLAKNKVRFKPYSLLTYCIPIIDNLNKKTQYYEYFLDVKDSNNNILSPSDYLLLMHKEDEKKSTSKNILKYSFKILANTHGSLNINLFLSEIEDLEIRNYLYILLNENKKYCHNIVFTLLEEHKIKDYSLIKHFIFKAKEFGVKFSLNKFTHSSSSFERLLLFDPDIIRIDESLINSLHRNHFSKEFLKTANEFARAQNIKMIAPYVKNEKNICILQELKIPYSQGKKFYETRLNSYNHLCKGKHSS